MNQHKRIMGEIARQYEAFSDAVIVSPSALAHQCFEAFATGDEDQHIQYTSIEHLKQMARDYLRSRHDADGANNPSHCAQGEMDFGVKFSGQLQPRYPLPRKKGEEPVYKLRSELTSEERAWNVSQLRKSAQARQEHADALEAEGQVRPAA